MKKYCKIEESCLSDNSKVYSILTPDLCTRFIMSDYQAALKLKTILDDFFANNQILDIFTN